MDTNGESTCAGKKIRASMQMFSHDLLDGCIMFAELAKKAQSENKIRCYNTACIFFATSSIEAKINEWISIAQACYKDEPKSFCHSLAPLVKKLTLSEKWNLIAANENGTLWDKSKEPFQSYELIISLRNELTHYKGQFLEKGGAPNRKIKDLMNRFGIKGKSKFVEDDTYSWVHDLLSCRELGKWIASRIIKFDNSILALWNSIT